MKIVSWNVNGVRAAVTKGFVDVARSFDADFICIQETKAQDDQVMEALANLPEYTVTVNSAVKKGYSGTAILSRIKVKNNFIDIGIEEHDQEGRVTAIETEGFHLVNVYVPNSGSGLKRLDYRSEWDKAFTTYIAGLQKVKPVILTGDFNVAHEAIDLARPKENFNKTSGYTQKEIDGMGTLLSTGLIDTFRNLHKDKVQYTFWNQRFKARDRNVGWRIDYFLVAESLMPKVKDSVILDNVMGSDHCPIVLELNL